MSPSEMDRELPSIFEALASLKAGIVHYKVCSTFDSASTVGSIGHAMDIARRTFGSGTIPIVAGTPALSRYCIFGNLFARSGTDGIVYRIDRHPIMSVHPVTPMDEADLVIHLGRQTSTPISKFTLPNFSLGRVALQREYKANIGAFTGALLIDSTEKAHLTEVGGLLNSHIEGQKSTFVVGSSGVEYALTQWWAEQGEFKGKCRDFEAFLPVNQALAISGSASALSAKQIDSAVTAGFAEVAIDASALVDASIWESAAVALVTSTTELLAQGKSVILHTARGPNDPRINTLINSLMARGESREQAVHSGGRLLGVRLGEIVQKILIASPVRRLLLSGGDTSSQITRVLAPDAIEIEARLSPGAPLCRVISDKPHLKDLQIALKGGQMGDASYFVRALQGSPKRIHN
jgi:3-oxoisoapionate kinase